MTSNIIINYWKYLVLNIVIKLFAKFKKKYINIVIIGIFSTKYCD